MSHYNESSMNSNHNGTCVVCYKTVEIYSIGMCEHPVCYECSTRMRVLCQQNECPICRQDLPNVVFTKVIKPFRHLKKGSLLDTRYNIYFDDPDIQARFIELLAHVCTVCNEKKLFSNFNSLKDHMRKIHDLQYCDLCVQNLTIFSHERRCYSRPDLVHHRRKGDKDDKSHKGHPLCEFCDLRYMDNDELFRHLRRDHLYCHFCDADGLHQYYSSYDYLRDHFRQEHYLCEEGPCAEEKFTSVFRSDIDLKAHKASIHGKFLGKAAAKQARTLELEFTLAPRGDNRNVNRRGGVPMSVGGPSNSRNNNSNDYGQAMYTRDYQPELSNINPFEVESSSMRQPDVQSTEEFPSLGNATTTPVPSLNVTKSKGRGNLTIRGSLKPQTLAVTDENFPALGPESFGNTPLSKTVNLSVYSNKTVQNGQPRPQSAAPNVSIRVNHKTDGSITTRVSGPNLRIRPNTLSMDSDFPALGRAESSSSAASTSNANQWTKVTRVKPSGTSSSSSKVKKVIFNPTPRLDLTPPASPPPPKSFVESFPSLPKTKKESSVAETPSKFSSTWNQPVTVTESNGQNASNDMSKANSKKKKKKKVKPSVNGSDPMNSKLNSSVSRKVQNDHQPSGESASDFSGVKNKANANNSKQTASDINNIDSEGSSDINALKSVGTTESNKGKGDSTPRKRSELKIDTLNRAPDNSRKPDDFPALGKASTTASKFNPPPGFGATPPPPGFAVKLQNNYLDRNDNGLTFTNSSGISYSIMPDEHNNSHSYNPPPDFQKRNLNLVAKISNFLDLEESMKEFKSIGRMFRQGLCSAKDYYERCRNAMGISAFQDVFPEMLVLLPDIHKQQELFDLHKKEVGQKISSLVACSTCGQIVKTGEDVKSHYSYHSLESDFPRLGTGTGANQTANSWVRKET